VDPQGFEMGVMNHNCIVATTSNDEKADELQKWIKGLNREEQQLFVRAGSWVNQYFTFMLVPDGSKEGWEESHRGDFLRNRLIERLNEDNHEDGSSPWDWVELGFGEYGQKALRGNCDNVFNDAEYALTDEP
jgi:hypothetical protein